MISEVERGCSIPEMGKSYPIFGYEDDVARLAHYRWVLEQLGIFVMVRG